MKRIIATKIGSRIRLPLVATDASRENVVRLLGEYDIPSIIIGNADDSTKRKTIFCVTESIAGLPRIQASDFERWLRDHIEYVPPGIVTQMVNFVTASVVHVASGFPGTSEMELKHRRALCLSCNRHADGRCTVCGCYTTTKTAWAEQSCPLGKW